MEKFIKENGLIIFAGLFIGATAVFLTAMGNPANMGYCIACFIRDTAGALGLHGAAKVQYIRPEIIGLVLGSFFISYYKKDFAPRGGSSPVQRFFLAIFVMIGALVFLGCPLRMIIRIGGGDFNAILGLFGFAAGIFVGTIFLNRGFSFKRSYTLAKPEGITFPVVAVFLLVLLLAAPAFINFSTEGPGSQHAPWILSLIVGLAIGALLQRSRLCTAGGIRDAMMYKKFHLLYGLIAILIAVFIGNMITGNFNPGFADQPIAHTDGLWNFLGMALVGWGAVLLGGCPLRQVALSGEGNGNSVVVVLGLFVGAAISHNFGLASSGAGVTTNGMIAVGIGFIVFLIVSLTNTEKVSA